ncbi:MAG: hypothetical protein FWH14_04935 [Oscillospiraceae bacterium]|nr:hypothetical protein [Oscillospiraceae bacterium]
MSTVNCQLPSGCRSGGGCFSPKEYGNFSSQAPFPSGEGCRRSGGVVCRDDRPRSSVVTAAAERATFLFLTIQM